ncbi:hypothetical protein HMPREF1981_01507 [Bacteroides pyogenes F0041]|uniref:Uncharacterized protein n=1 Tax=Bacteroides pyogenes F0041 TaxID=1321819 RepID=U2DVH0_9BACE|nr:hypothetical protein HMPREF1981_01507 [Bacteroides pyogenes F0041]MBB3895976.1 hypothetical protein [Bacteroides pyogenes]SUV36204.1 Uncharacterised protein [Bacteroides pyogenes]
MVQNIHKENQLLYNNEIFLNLIVGVKKRKSRNEGESKRVL